MCVGNRFIRIFLVAILLIPALSYAQTQREKQSDISESETSADKGAQANSNAALLEELETMRKRIEQLEAQLKAQFAEKGDATSRDTAGQLQAAPLSMLAAGPAASSTAVPNSTTPIETQAAKSGTPASTAKAEPFAFADFTWLEWKPTHQGSCVRFEVLYA
jgi:hypothetical protein